jgi:hypothetical protein
MREKSHIIGASVKAYLVKARTTAEGEVLNPFLSELKVILDAVLQSTEFSSTTSTYVRAGTPYQVGLTGTPDQVRLSGLLDT